MSIQITGKEVIKDMEYLLKLLKKEWEGSGKTKAEAVISLEETGKVNQKLAEQITIRQKVLENEELTFKQSMDVSRENYILLRLVKKIKKAEERTNQKGLDSEFIVDLDKEEFKLFQSIFEQ